MIFPILFPMFGGVGGATTKPRTSGPAILATVIAMVTIIVAGFAFHFGGFRGLLIVPAFYIWVWWLALWGWLGAQCLDHSCGARGAAAVAYTTAFVLCLAVVLASATIGLLQVVAPPSVRLF